MSEDRFNMSRRTAMGVAGLAAAAGAAPFALTGRASADENAVTGALPNRPFFNEGQLGGFKLMTVFDGYVQLDGPHPIFGADQPAETVEDLAQQRFLPPKKMEIGFTPTIVDTGSERILFDTGNPDSRRPTAGLLAERMALAGIDPSSIDVVVITHFHPDHIGGLRQGNEATFPNARYVTGQAEYDFWTAEERLTGPTENTAKLVQDKVVPLADKFTFIAPGDDVASGITAIEAFGHTPGHLAFNIESEGARLVITADTANHYVVSLQRPEWEVRFDMDKAKAAETRKELFGMIAADRVPFIGYHMPFPSIGYVETVGGNYRWVPASYQLTI